MTCYLRLHELAVAVHPDVMGADWDVVHRRWLQADGVRGRDEAFEAMPVTLIELDDLPGTDLSPFAGVVLSGRSDQELLAARRDDIAAFLERGRVVVFQRPAHHRLVGRRDPLRAGRRGRCAARITGARRAPDVRRSVGR